MAFQNFNLVKGIFGSEFGGLNNFKFLFADGTRQTVLKVIGNTLYLNILFIFFSTLASVALAIIFNEVRNKHVKKVTQTLSILPYFVSWAVIALFLEGFLKADGGMLSTFLAQHGMNISFYSDPGPWRLILVIMRIWQVQATVPSSTSLPSPAWIPASMRLPKSTVPAAGNRSFT